ncbi:MAG: radical SAM protein [Candidatus Omnitrophica bacterium]|nr:radical SAM protein [Candidatus Omnitrophota bacterium]
MATDDKRVRIEKVLPDIRKMLEVCVLCRRECRAERAKGQGGYCRSGFNAVIHSYGLHHGEEPPISGYGGSGTIFFSNCSMGCVYCQNYQFSQSELGREVTSSELAGIMMELQDTGAHNINLVTPTHFVYPILEALREACIRGLEIPVVYNTGGYDSLAVIKALDGIVDIYLPDMRYSDDRMAEKYSCSPDYVANNRAIVSQMNSQVSRLVTEDGVAKRGLIIRLLILPGNISGTLNTLEFIAEELGKDTYISVMSQYYPAYKAGEYAELAGSISLDDYHAVIDKMEQRGLDNGWVQSYHGGFDERFAGENFKPNI